MLAAFGDRKVDERAGTIGLAADRLRDAAKLIGAGERVAVLFRRERAVDRTLQSAVVDLGATEEDWHVFGGLVRETNQQGAIDLGVLPREGGLAGRDMVQAGRLKALYLARLLDGRRSRARSTRWRQLEFLVVQDHVP